MLIIVPGQNLVKSLVHSLAHCWQLSGKILPVNHHPACVHVLNDYTSDTLDADPLGIKRHTWDVPVALYLKALLESILIAVILQLDVQPLSVVVCNNKSVGCQAQEG